ncbi:MAG: HEAT repeat domain-containing protein [Thermaerobacter sp.]|nr:HEAT repeat domain-containing protein [Thermaerobacter sp.]
MARLLLQRFHGASLLSVAIQLSTCTEPGAQEVGALLLPAAYPLGPEEVSSALKQACMHPHWEVREWAASALGALLSAHVDAVFPIVDSWATDPSDLLRRGVVIALMEYGKVCAPEKAQMVLDALRRMLHDPAPYVQKNLGPFAIGSVLAARFPEAVLASLREWVHDEDAHARQQVALIFSAAAGARLAKAGRDVLDILLADPRPEVQRAVRKALRRMPDA